MIYYTTFKKGNLVQIMHFEHDGSLPEAVSKVKTFLEKKHLKHIHTVPFLVDLEENFETEELHAS